MAKRKVQYAPLLSEGARVKFGHGLPPGIKEGVRAIARMERRSMSWVLERIIVDWVCSKRMAARPVYRKPKAKEAA